ncbi:MAG TPA: hydrolase [Anaeromyxobacteraceae bacterium]
MSRLPKLDRSKACVLLVDVQEKLIPVMWNFAPVEKYCKAMILAARELGLPVLATEQYPKGLGATLPSLREALGAAPLVKMHFSCGADPEFAKALAATGRKQVVLLGIEAHVCVFQTARDLLEQGYEVFVCADAVTSRFEEHRRVALEQMRDMGAVVTSAETCIFDLLHACGTPEFKRVSPLVR